MKNLKTTLGFNLYDAGVVVFCVTFGFTCFYPMWYVLVVSFMPYESYAYFGKSFILFPPRISLVYYRTVIIASDYVFGQAMFISFSKTAIGATLALTVTAMAAYAISKREIRGMKFLNVYMIFTMFFSGGLIPLYLLVRNLGLYDSYWAMIIPYLIQIGHFIIMRNYFSYIVPRELEDSAVVDGANEILLFFKIIVPIAKPMIAAIFLFEAVFHWNDYYSYLIFVDDFKLQPFVWVLRRVLRNPIGGLLGNNPGFEFLADEGIQFLPPAGLKMATIICAMVPIMLLYPFLQRHFAKGILIGAVKE